MTDCRAYLIGRDDHIKAVCKLDCLDDHAAVDEARQFVNGHHVELWERARKIACSTYPVARPAALWWHH